MKIIGTYAIWIIAGVIALILMLAGIRQIYRTRAAEQPASFKSRLLFTISFCLLLFPTLLGISDEKPLPKEPPAPTTPDSKETELQKAISQRIDEVKKTSEWNDLKKVWKDLTKAMIKGGPIPKKLKEWGDKYQKWGELVRTKQDAKTPLFSKEDSLTQIQAFTTALIWHLYRSRGAVDPNTGRVEMVTCYKPGVSEGVHNKDLDQQEELLDKQFKEDKISKKVYDKVKSTLKTLREADKHGLQVGAYLNQPNTELIFRLIQELNTKQVVKVEKIDPVLQKTIDELITQLGNDDWPKREQATEQLIMIGAPAIESLQKVAKSNDPEVRLRVKQILDKIIEPDEEEEELTESIEQLIRQLGNENFQTRENATKELIKIGKPAILALEKASKSPDPEIRLRAQKVLEQIK